MSFLLRAFYYLILWVDFLILTVIVYLATFLPKAALRGFPLLFRFWCRLFVRALGVRLVMHQQNQRALPEHYIVISNHPSIFEDIGIPAMFDVVCLAKQELGSWWIFGRIARAAGTVFVSRDNEDSRREATDRMVSLARSGRNLALYPEGGCTGRRINPRFYNGAFDVSLKTGVPIIPVFLHYEAQESFEWGDQSGPQKVRDIMRAPNRKANYYVFDALYPENYSDKDSYKAQAHALYLGWQQRYLD